MMRGKGGKERGLVWSVTTNFSPYMSIHFHQGETLHLASVSASLCDCAVLTQWHMSAISSVSHSHLHHPHLLPSVSLFYLSAPIASSGLHKLAESTESEMPAVTWPTGGNASIDASIHKVLSPICKPVHLAALDLTSRVKKDHSL